MNFLSQATFAQSQGVAVGSIDQRSSFADDVPEQPKAVVSSGKRYYKRKEIRRNRNKVRML